MKVSSKSYGHLRQFHWKTLWKSDVLLTRLPAGWGDLKIKIFNIFYINTIPVKTPKIYCLVCAKYLTFINFKSVSKREKCVYSQRQVLQICFHINKIIFSMQLYSFFISTIGHHRLMSKTLLRQTNRGGDVLLIANTIHP